MSTSNRTAESEDFSGATRRLAHDIRLGVEREQQGVATFADQMLLAFAAHLESGGEADDGHAREALARLTRLVARRAEGRYVDYDTRLQGAGTDGARDIGYFEMVTSQGEMGCLKWKGKPLSRLSTTSASTRCSSGS